MTFPTNHGISTNFTGGTGNSTTTGTQVWADNGFSSVSVGELCIIVISVDGSPTVSVTADADATGWVKLGQASEGSGAVTGAIFYKIATVANANMQCSLSFTASEQWTANVYRFTGTNLALEGASATGSSTNSNPPNLTPSGGSQDYTWIATRSGDGTTQATVAPTGYGTLSTTTAGGTNGASTASTVKSATASSEDPGTFTSATEQWVSWTIGVWGSSDVTLALTGLSATGSRGTLTASSDSAVVLTGASATGAVGDLMAVSGFSAALTTVLGTAQPGSVSPTSAIALATVAGAGARGTVGPSLSAVLSGLSRSGSTGSVLGATARSLTGVVGSGAVGTLSPSVTSGVTVGLTCVSGSGAVGNLTPSIFTGLSVPLTGVSAGGALGVPIAFGESACGWIDVEPAIKTWTRQDTATVWAAASPAADPWAPALEVLQFEDEGFLELDDCEFLELEAA